MYEALVNIGIEKSGELLDLPSEDALTFFNSAARAVLDGARKNPWTAKMFALMNDAWRSESLPIRLRHKLRYDNIEKSAESIKLGQSQKTIRDGDPVALASAFWGAILGVCQMASADRNFVYPEHAWIVDIIRR